MQNHLENSKEKGIAENKGMRGEWDKKFQLENYKMAEWMNPEKSDLLKGYLWREKTKSQKKGEGRRESNTQQNYRRVGN